MLANHLGSRLITQNFLAAAALYERGPQQIGLDNIADLCVFIDLFCLYDELRVMGRHAYSLFPAEHSDFFGVLHGIVHVDDFDIPIIGPTAAAHLVAYLGDTRPAEHFEPLFDMLLDPDSVERAFRPIPDSRDDLQFGIEWFQTLPDGAEIIAEIDRDAAAHRSVTFFVRTFLYLAQADASRLVLTPDGTRGPVLAAVTAAERKLERALRAHLAVTLRDAFQENRIGDEFELTRRITPLAAIVFDRAAPYKANIPTEMLRLRNALAPLRARLRRAEDDIFWLNRDRELDVFKTWNSVFAEIEREFGRGEHLLNVTTGLGFAEAAATAAMKPKEPKGWLHLLSMPVEVLRRMLTRQTFVELHRLRKELPASERLRRKAEELFR